MTTDKDADTATTLNIHKELLEDYTMSYMIPDQTNTNSPNNSVSIYIKINNNELSINSNNIDSMDSSVKFEFHYISPENIGGVNDENSSAKQYAFYSQFIQTEKSGIKTIHSINDSTRNPYKESELRSYFTTINNGDIPLDDSNIQTILSDRLPYSPDFVDGDGKYRESEYKNQFSRDSTDYSAITNDNVLDDKTIYECKNECHNDPDCNKFLFQIDGRPNKSEAYKGSCILVNSSDASRLSTGSDFSGFSKIQDVMSVLPTQTESVPTSPPVINNKDESCTIRAQVCAKIKTIVT